MTLSFSNRDSIDQRLEPIKHRMGSRAALAHVRHWEEHGALQLSGQNLKTGLFGLYQLLCFKCVAHQDRNQEKEGWLPTGTPRQWRGQPKIFWGKPTFLISGSQRVTASQSTKWLDNLKICVSPGYAHAPRPAACTSVVTDKTQKASKARTSFLKRSPTPVSALHTSKRGFKFS